MHEDPFSRLYDIDLYLSLEELIVAFLLIDISKKYNDKVIPMFVQLPPICFDQRDNWDINMYLNKMMDEKEE